MDWLGLQEVTRNRSSWGIERDIANHSPRRMAKPAAHTISTFFFYYLSFNQGFLVLADSTIITPFVAKNVLFSSLLTVMLYHHDFFPLIIFHSL